MTDDGLRPEQLARLGALIARATGLNFQREHRDDLRRGIAGASHEFGFADAGACAAWLLSGTPTQAQIEVLAAHLTVGETYFFREPQSLKALAEHVLPALIHARRGEQRLRIWSAACCSGEEPYSLAIMLHDALPDLDRWDVKIIATDINARALRKAAAGSYGEWSFRDAPPGLKERWFDRAANGRYVISPCIRRLVSFSWLNLVDEAYPALGPGTMDLVFCRNVLMYFTAPQVRKVVARLHRTMADGAWLVVSPSEASHTLFAGFATENFPGAILYRKSAAMPVPSAAPEAAAAPVPPWPHLPVTAAVIEPSPAPLAPSLPPVPMRATAAKPPHPRDQARTLADQGQLADALRWCERWVDEDKLDAAAHYLRAVILLESAQPEQARACLQRAVYLDPGFVLAHFVLGNLARSSGKNAAAEKHFANALAFLRALPADELVPESDGLSARRLTETITSMLATATPS